MNPSFLRSVVKIGFGLAALAAVVAALTGHVAWALGDLTAACWMFLNLFFLYKLLEMGVRMNAQRHPGRMLVLAMLKFPAIYLAGFFILKTGYFPLDSILTGMTAFFIAIGISWVSGVRKQAVPAVFIFLLSSTICFLSSDTAFASDAHHAEPSHAVSANEGHGAHAEGSHDAHPETINWVLLIARSMPGTPIAEFLMKWEKAIFTGIVVLLITLLFTTASKNLKRNPGRLQAFLEILISGLDSLVCGVIGAHGRKYTPFLGSLFIYILASNLLGLIPLQNSTMAYLTTVLPVTVSVFFYVQWVGIRTNGLVGYLLHLCGSPKDIFGWVMAPLMFPLHVLGEFIKPLSLTFRLYGNIMSGHLLLAVFLGMGVSMLKGLPVPAGIPIHFPFLFLEILVGVIQAFVFTLLSTIYIAMMLPHEHEHAHTEAHDGHGTEAAPAKH